MEKLLLPGGENGLGEDVPSKYFLNFFSDFPFLHEPVQPAAKSLRRAHAEGAKGAHTLSTAEPSQIRSSTSRTSKISSMHLE
ncbi:MAG: hypothetical protein M3O20_11885 [Acidobacteriota bacterium]|nr:hypothetical protein [Acidobacteriota bacterium]